MQAFADKGAIEDTMKKFLKSDSTKAINGLVMYTLS